MCQIVSPGWNGPSTEHRGPGIHLQSTHTIWEPAKLIFKVRCGDSTVNTSIQADGQTDLCKPLYWPIRRDGSRQRWSCSPLVKSRLWLVSGSQVALLCLSSHLSRPSAEHDTGTLRCTNKSHNFGVIIITRPSQGPARGYIMMPREGPKLHNYIG